MYTLGSMQQHMEEFWRWGMRRFHAIKYRNGTCENVDVILKTETDPFSHFEHMYEIKRADTCAVLPAETIVVIFQVRT